MPASEFRKKAFVFIVFAGIVILILLLMPSAEEQLKAYFQNQFGITITPDGHSVPASGEQRPGMMVETSISLVVNALRIVKILIWMALVISVIRFLGSVILSTIRGTQSEVASLIKTVFSIILYIVSFFIIFQTQYPEVPLAPLFTGSTILGIVVGLALQDTLGNLFAGIALQADQPFQVGDVVTFMNAQRGVIESVSWRGVKIRTFENRILVVSNSSLGKEMDLWNSRDEGDDRTDQDQRGKYAEEDRGFAKRARETFLETESFADRVGGREWEHAHREHRGTEETDCEKILGVVARDRCERFGRGRRGVNRCHSIGV